MNLDMHDILKLKLLIMDLLFSKNFKITEIKPNLIHYNAYCDEIDLQIKRNESWSKEELFKRHPFLSKEHA
jgi:hypothetical protein